MEDAGYAGGEPPEEVALIMAARLSVAHLFDLQPAVIEAWIRERKIDPHKMRHELGKFGLWHLL
jgi:hypothetical protein